MMRGGHDHGVPPHLSAGNDNVTMLEVLIDAGADIDERSGDLHPVAAWRACRGALPGLTGSESFNCWTVRPEPSSLPVRHVPLRWAFEMISRNTVAITLKPPPTTSTI